MRAEGHRYTGEIALLACVAASAASAAGAEARLKESRLEAVHEQRIEWMKKRAPAPLPGIYQDFRAVLTHAEAPRAELAHAAREAGAKVVFAGHETGFSGGVLFLPLPDSEVPAMEIYRRPAESADQWRKMRGRLRQYPQEVLGAGTDSNPDLLAAWDREWIGRHLTGIAFSDSPAAKVVPIVEAFKNTSTHILARELAAPEVRTSLAHGHAYVAHDWLCDPTGFLFVAENTVGTFDMGDTVPATGETRLRAAFPVPAKVKLIRDGSVVAEQEGSIFTHEVKQPGAYRIEAWLSAGGEDRPWLFSNPVYVRGSAEMSVPVSEAAGIETHFDIPYVEGGTARQKLDLYLPKGWTKFPVMMFVHGGAWRTGDRSLYRTLGSRFAGEGIGVVIPSYRLMPQNPFPAQIGDVADAFAWVFHNIARYGGDRDRLYLSGHSAGGHLVSLLALDHSYLAQRGIPVTAIQGVISMSGVYDVTNVPQFGFDGNREVASPMSYVRGGAPPFLITYCQWDFLGLPRQAREFGAALKKAFDAAQVVYIPNETHASEILSAMRENSPLARAILDFLK